MKPAQPTQFAVRIDREANHTDITIHCYTGVLFRNYLIDEGLLIHNIKECTEAVNVVRRRIAEVKATNPDIEYYVCRDDSSGTAISYIDLLTAIGNIYKSPATS